MNLFLWGALPYIAFTFLIVGTLVRFFYFERNWTTKSSEFLEKKQLRIANPLFHFGLLCVIGGHVVGVLVPKTWTAAMGINDHMYHEGALYMGAVAGIIFIVGFLLLMKRRFTVPAMKVNTSGFDKWLYLFLTLAIFSGMAGTLLNASGFFDYRVSIGPWFRSLLSFMPDPSLMEGVPFMFKFHMLAWMVVAIIFPFSRLVHLVTIRKDSVFVPYHWGGVNAANQLTVGLEGLDPISKMPEFKVCACKIEKTGEKKAKDSAEYAYRSRDVLFADGDTPIPN